MNILITGAAGFIGFHVCKRLLDLGHTVIGIDNINDYYNIDLKLSRLRELGIYHKEALIFHEECSSSVYKDFMFFRIGLENKSELSILFEKQKIDVVCNLAAQAGVRYSIENPEVYIQSNIVGFLNLLECCRNYTIKHFVYASSSSVYGKNSKIPFSEEDKVDEPVSLYAATKKSNELMAHTYSHLYNLPTTGLRFFTVYGPWGRPDMAPMLFADAILNNRAINVFNHGEMERDFTFIDDVVEGIIRIIEKPLDRVDLYKIYNIGNNNSVKLLDFISTIEVCLGIKAEKVFLPMQDGDVKITWADVSNLIKDYNYKPKINISSGVKEFIKWYLNYNNI